MIRELICEESGMPISQCSHPHGDPNTETAWGVYAPGRRIEIEAFGWDAESRSGWGPGASHRTDRCCLTQREEASPHPLTWHSPVYAGLDEARKAFLTIRIAEAESQREAYLKIPGVSEIAFALHHALAGCNNGKSLAECDRKCVSDAVEIVEQVVADRDLVGHGLTMIRTPEEDLS